MILVDLLLFGVFVAIAGACGGHHHHRTVSHLRCDLDEARGALGRRNRDDETWRPAHIAHRVEDLFETVEAARERHDWHCLHEVATPHGVEELQAFIRRGGRHHRHLEHVSIALCVDHPGDRDDEVLAMVEAYEPSCHDHARELWKLVRGHDRDWVVDCVFEGEAIRRELDAARQREQGLRGRVPRDDGSGAVRRI